MHEKRCLTVPNLKTAGLDGNRIFFKFRRFMEVVLEIFVSQSKKHKADFPG